LAYQKSAPLYDHFAEKDDISYYKTHGLQYGNALEIGVGTMRVALALARVGVKVWGIDNSSHMLEEAEKKLQKESEAVQERISLLKADMRAFDLKRKFPFVYIPSSTIQYCSSKEEQLSCLDAINKHLTENGLLVFNLILPSQKYSDKIQLIGKAVHEDTTILRFISYKPKWQDQILEVYLFFEIYKKGIMVKRIIDASTISLIGKREIILLLEKTGFKVRNVYGDYNRSKTISNHIVVEAEKVDNV